MSDQISAIFPLLTALFLFSASLAAQPVIRTNEKGEAIIVFPDGSTQLFSEFSDESGQAPSGETDGEASGKYPILDVKVAPLEGNIPVTAEDLRRIAERKNQLAKDAARIAQERAEEASRQRERAEKAYVEASRATAGERQLRQLEQRLLSARELEAEARREATMAINEAGRTEEITRRGNYVEEYQRRQQLKRQQARQYENVSITSTATYENIASEKNYLPFSQTEDVMISPPSPGCRFAYEGIDEQGRLRRDLQQQVLFTHTDDRLRPYLKGVEYLTCKGYFTQLGGFRYLSLEFSFAYPNAREAYGFIEKGSYLMVKLLNGQFITLFAGKMDKGTYDTESGLLSYLVHYPIDQSQINLLRRSEADSVIVSWSSGYEEYEVFELGFFINQILCLEK